MITRADYDIDQSIPPELLGALKEHDRKAGGEMTNSAKNKLGKRSIFRDEWDCPFCGRWLAPELDELSSEEILAASLELECPNCEHCMTVELEWTDPEIHAATFRQI